MEPIAHRGGIPRFGDPGFTDFWCLKIASLLHDPPFKPWTHAKHAELAAEVLPESIANLKIGDEAIKDLVKAHHQRSQSLVGRSLVYADRCSSAVERFVLNFIPTKKKAKDVRFIHPLSGRELGENPSLTLTRETTKEELNKIQEYFKQHVEEYFRKTGILNKLTKSPELSVVKAAYLLIWRKLEEISWEVFGNVLGKRVKLLIPPPADTRVPNHTVFDHVEGTSALSTCCRGYSLHATLVSFDIGGVQPFISAAKKTGDLWAGSWLVSLLAWSALRGVSEFIGPDSVIFPYLKGIPLVDIWIAHNILGDSQSTEEDFENALKFISSPDEVYDKLTLSLIPPSATIIVPTIWTDKVKDLICEGLKKCWEKIVNEVWETLKELLKDDLEEQVLEEAKNRYERQTKYLPIGPIRVVHTELPRTSREVESFLNSHEEMIPKSLSRILRKYLELSSLCTDNRPLPSIMYSVAFAVNSSKLSSLVHDFELEFEPGLSSQPTQYTEKSELLERCNICGIRNPLFLKKDVWRKLASKQVVEWEPFEDRGEYLCSVCLIKRLLSREKLFKRVLESVVGLPKKVSGKLSRNVGFPSTSDFAMANFKRTLFELVKERGDPELEKLMETFLQSIANLQKKLNVRPASKQPPVIQRLIEDHQEGWSTLELVLGCVGELLDPDTYRRLATRIPDDLKDELEPELKSLERIVSQISGKVLDRIISMKIAEESRPPLVLDSRSFSGENFSILLSDGDYMGLWLTGEKLPKFVECVHPYLREVLRSRAGSICDEPRPLSPSVHISISRILLHYAKDIVPRIIEEVGLGSLIYAGGDDIMAFIAPENAILTAQLLAEEFMREWDNRSGRILLGFGCKGSCSAGLVIAHYMSHLTSTIANANELKEEAKELDGGELRGKGAVKIGVYGRSGSIIVMSSPLHWIEPWNSGDPNGLVYLVRSFEEDGFIWVGVSHLLSRNDFVNELFKCRAVQDFFSPIIAAYQVGAITRGGIGRLANVRVSRRLLYDLRDLVTELGCAKDIDILIALMKREMRRHTESGQISTTLKEILLDNLKKFTPMDRVIHQLSGMVDVAVVSDHIHEYSRILCKTYRW